VPARDAAALAAALERLVADARLRREQGEAARERVRAHFNNEDFAPGLARIVAEAGR
jgi:glycosyltransferase involved in cell wall biosynthesis